MRRLDVKGGIPSPLHNPPMRVYAMPHWFVYSLIFYWREDLFGLLFHIVGRDEDHKAERNGNDTGDDLQLIPAAGEAQNQGEGVEDQADQGDKPGPLILDASLAATRSR